MYKITIVHGHSSIEILHSLIPFISLQKAKRLEVEFINYKFTNIFNKSGDLLVLLRKYQDGEMNEEIMISEIKKLKKIFQKLFISMTRLQPLVFLIVFYLILISIGKDRY